MNGISRSAHLAKTRSFPFISFLLCGRASPPSLNTTGSFRVRRQAAIVPAWKFLWRMPDEMANDSGRAGAYLVSRLGLGDSRRQRNDAAERDPGDSQQ